MDFLRDTFGIFNEKKLKSHIKMAITRIKVESKKQINLTKHYKKEIANLIRTGRTELAQIKVEHIIRTDDTIEGYGILELYLELLSERVHYIVEGNSGDPPPSDLMEPISSVIWAATKVNIDELSTVMNQFKYKYGADFHKYSESNKGDCVNERLTKKLSMVPISARLINGYLQEIAKTYEVEYVPIEEKEEEGKDILNPTHIAPTGTSIPIAPASGYRGATEYANDTQQQKAGFTIATEGSQVTPVEKRGNVTGKVTAMRVEEGVYTGEVNTESLPHGKGKLVFNDERLYEGNFNGGGLYGKGKMCYTDGTIFEGKFWGGIREGDGTLIKDGCVLYDGKWAQDMPVTDFKKAKSSVNAQAGYLLTLAASTSTELLKKNANNGNLKESGSTTVNAIATSIQGGIPTASRVDTLEGNGNDDAEALEKEFDESNEEEGDDANFIPPPTSAPTKATTDEEEKEKTDQAMDALAARLAALRK